MCEFLDYLGWFSLSPADQWDVIFKAMGTIVAIGIAWWTVRSWFLAKKIEIENSLLDHCVTAMSYWSHFEGDSATSEERNEAKKYSKQFMMIIDEVIKEDLSLKRLRKLNKNVFVKALSIDKYWSIARDHALWKHGKNVSTTAKF